MEGTCEFLDNLYDKQKIDGLEVITYICDNTNSVLDPLDQITYGMNEVLVSYGSVVVLKDAP